MAKHPKKPALKRPAKRRARAPRHAQRRTPRPPPEVRSAPTAALMQAMEPAMAQVAPGQPVQRSRGRPTKYDPAFCEVLLDHMAGGFSFESFAGVIGVSKQTLYNWLDTKEYGDFVDAKSRGEELCRLWWERLGIQGVQGLGPRVLAEENEEVLEVKGQPVYDAGGNPMLKIKRKFAAAQFVPGTWFRNMTNRFPAEWRDRHEVTGKDGKDLIPPPVDWSTLAPDGHVQAFLAERAKALGQAQPQSAPQAPKVEPVKPV